MVEYFSETVFGGIGNVKELLAKELRQKRTMSGRTDEFIDERLRIDHAWPKCRQIEEDPHLFNRHFMESLNEAHHQKIVPFGIGGFELRLQIMKYLCNSNHHNVRRIAILFGISPISHRLQFQHPLRGAMYEVIPHNCGDCYQCTKKCPAEFGKAQVFLFHRVLEEIGDPCAT